VYNPTRREANGLTKNHIQMDHLKIEMLDKIAEAKANYNASLVKDLKEKISEIADGYRMGLITPNEYAFQVADASVHIGEKMQPFEETRSQDSFKNTLKTAEQ
tara:strand:+ start:891 stop:1199 length:309 start_codon:yes stop_codon:yes gene_type:complete